MKRFSKNGYQQIHIDVNFMRLFLKEYLIKDDQTLLVGFILEIMQNCSHNSITYENYDESVKYNFNTSLYNQCLIALKWNSRIWKYK